MFTHTLDLFLGVRDRSRKTIFCFWLPLGFLVNLAYKTNLLASLVTVVYEPPIDSNEDVLASGLPVWVPKGGWFEDVFVHSNNPVLNEIYIKNIIAKNTLYKHGSLPKNHGEMTR